MNEHVSLGELLVPAEMERAGSRGFTVLSMTSSAGLVPQTSIFKKAIASRDLSSYKVVRPNQLVVGIHVDEGALGFSGANQVGIVSPAYTIWKLRNPGLVHIPYLDRFVRSPLAIAYFISNYRETAERRGKLTHEQFLALSLPFPPLAEQRRIAAILDQADALRVKRREALALLDELQRGIFIEMFGDPAQNPRGFLIKQLATLVAAGDTINYGVVQPGDDMDSGIPLIRVGDLVAGRVRHDSLKTIAPSIEAAYKRSRLHGDEILVSCVGSIGVIALATQSEKNFNIARAVARIRLAPSTNRVFMAAQLSTPGIQHYFTNELRTVSQPTLNIKQIAETSVMCPPTTLQEDFEGRIEKLELLKNSIRTSAHQLEELFASLQHHAFRGEL